MVCRHSKDDTSCSSHPRYVAPYTPPPVSNSPDATRYNVLEAEQVGRHLVLRVLYPNCSKCSFEGKKVMVFLNVSSLDALKWKEIDPHFRPDQKLKSLGVAPSPAARFPSTPDGWTDAITYAKGKA